MLSRRSCSVCSTALARRSATSASDLLRGRASALPPPSPFMVMAAATPVRRFGFFSGGTDATDAAAAAGEKGDAAAGTWHVWRQDTHGNTSCINTFKSKNDAESKCAELTCHEHKQHFWVSADSAMSNSGADECSRWFSSPGEDPLYTKQHGNDATSSRTEK